MGLKLRIIPAGDIFPSMGSNIVGRLEVKGDKWVSADLVQISLVREITLIVHALVRKRKNNRTYTRWEDTVHRVTQTLNTVNLSGPREFVPEQTVDFPFSIPIPEGIPPFVQTSHVSVDYYLRAEVVKSTKVLAYKELNIYPVNQRVCEEKQVYKSKIEGLSVEIPLCANSKDYFPVRLIYHPPLTQNIEGITAGILRVEQVDSNAIARSSRRIIKVEKEYKELLCPKRILGNIRVSPEAPLDYVDTLKVPFAEGTVIADIASVSYYVALKIKTFVGEIEEYYPIVILARPSDI